MTGNVKTVLSVALLLASSAILFALPPRQGANATRASVTIDPTEVTLHLGETQTFEAMVKGTETTGIRWTIQERSGGHITEDGIYTAPRHIGLYHVVATSEENPAAKAVAKVTVITEYDPRPEAQKLR